MINQYEPIISENIESVVLELLGGYEPNEVLIITDDPIVKVYDTLLRALKNYPIFVFKRALELVPDEYAIGQVYLATTEKTKMILGIGSGVVNDICRYVSYRMGINYSIIMSAPSMDGYASTVSALNIDGFKRTFYCHRAGQLIGDVGVLENAPMSMILSGLGDFLGKVTALMDWQLANIITGELLNKGIVDDLYMGMDILETALYSITNKALVRDQEIRKMSAVINQWLIKSGQHMATMGNSRPASGNEHMMSHIMEMDRLRLKKPNIYHGIKVGVSTYYVLQMYQIMMVNIDEVILAYGLNEDQVKAIETIYHKGIHYLPMIEAYKNHVVKLHDLTKAELLDAMIRSITARERFVVATVLNQIGKLKVECLEAIFENK